jgi:hypothetical protein
VVTCTSARCPPIALRSHFRATWASSRTAEYWKHCVMHWDIRSIDRHRVTFELTTQENSSMNSHRCLATIVAKHRCEFMELCSWVANLHVCRCGSMVSGTCSAILYMGASHGQSGLATPMPQHCGDDAVVSFLSTYRSPSCVHCPSLGYVCSAQIPHAYRAVL